MLLDLAHGALSRALEARRRVEAEGPLLEGRPHPLLRVERDFSAEFRACVARLKFPDPPAEDATG